MVALVALVAARLSVLVDPGVRLEVGSGVGGSWGAQVRPKVGSFGAGMIRTIQGASWCYGKSVRLGVQSVVPGNLGLCFWFVNLISFGCVTVLGTYLARG